MIVGASRNTYQFILAWTSLESQVFRLFIWLSVVIKRYNECTYCPDKASFAYYASTTMRIPVCCSGPF
jgi:hypothetical protein